MLSSRGSFQPKDRTHISCISFTAGGFFTNEPQRKSLCMLPLLSRFSRIQLCSTLQTAAHQAPPSLGFSRQEHWSGLPFPSPMHEVKSEREVAQSCPTLSDPMDCSLPGSSICGIFQARVLEWGAIALMYTLSQFKKKFKQYCSFHSLTPSNNHV